MTIDRDKLESGLVDLNGMVREGRHAPVQPGEVLKADFLKPSSRPAMSLFTTTVTEAEILYGLYLMPPGNRRRDLELAIRDMFAIDLAGCIRPFDEASAHPYANSAVSRRQVGSPFTQFDAQIAAIARSRDAAIATRNVNDFEGCGISVINPQQS